jgi:hypothetical protein
MYAIAAHHRCPQECCRAVALTQHSLCIGKINFLCVLFLLEHRHIGDILVGTCHLYKNVSLQVYSYFLCIFCQYI